MKRVYKYIILLVGLFLTVSFQTIYATANKLPLISVDSPSNNSFIANSLNISGWALNASGVKEVDIYLDGQINGKATTGISRTDVNRIYPGYLGGSTSGFNYILNLDLNSILSGNHKISVKEVGNDGSTAERDINIIKPSPIINIDTPKQGQEVKGAIGINGCALNASGIKQVNILVDNIQISTATIGISRPDVNIVYPGYKDGDKSGYSYLLDTNNIARGTHLVKVQAIGNDGIVKEATVTINVNKLAPLLNVDYPIQNQIIKGNMLISGWALNISDVKEVDIYLDGQINGKATTGLSRIDVNRIYPGYLGGSTSGFNYELNLDLNSILSGNHKLAVKAVGNDGSTTERDINIIKPNPIINIDTPKQGQEVKGAIGINGWALNASGIKQVNILVDNIQISTATIGISRPDVNIVYPGYKDGDKSGYSYLLDTNNIARGTHLVKVQAIGNDGIVKEATVTINVNKLAPLLNIDYPIQNQIIKGNMLISGWALNASDVKEVDIYLDGQINGKATTGLSRIDVNRIYPGYLGGSTSGFNYELNLDLNSILSGNHKIAVKAVGNDGSITERDINIVKPSPLLCIDYPKIKDIIKNTIQVSGWALNASGIKQVKIYLDSTNNLVGSASIGGSRPDVTKAYPNYIDGTNSGYNYTMDTSSLTSGIHTIIVQAVGNDNEIKQTNVLISKGINKFIFTNTNVSLNDFENQEMSDTPAAFISGQWRYAIAKSDGELGYCTDPSSTLSISKTWVYSPTDYNNIKNQLIYNVNPLNSENDQTKIYEFLKLNYADCVTATQLNTMFSANGVLKGKGQVFIDAAKANNINPVYLASHAILETGNGTSVLANGGTKNSSGKYTYGYPVYNLFGIGAIDGDADSGGTSTAFSNGWTSIDLAIYGGAAWISNGYIAKYQNTLYEMRWNPLDISHQYATDVNWAASQASIIKKCFDLFPSNLLVFDIPVFN